MRRYLIYFPASIPDRLLRNHRGGYLRPCGDDDRPGGRRGGSCGRDALPLAGRRPCDGLRIVRRYRGADRRRHAPCGRYALGLARSYGCRLRLEAGRYEWTVAAFNSGYETSSPALRLTVAEEPVSEEPEKSDNPESAEP